MADYDFHELSPPDLELLARDLLQAELRVRIESFKTGRDGGVDLRYASGAGKLIVQVKHMVRTELKGLLRELKAETAKVRALRPRRYMVVTSVPLSAKNKADIVDIIGREWLAENDVLGREDLNNLLECHEEIHQQHFKLWLTSRAIIDRVLHSDIHTQTEFHVKRVRSQIRKYVPSRALGEALSILDRDRLVIISGPPGVGKTTLANLILYHHLAEDWHPIVMHSIADGLKMFQPGKRQIFYFDDFMGATFLGERVAATPGHPGDHTLVDFIGMVADTPGARLVLTTREHIFGQALAASERLRHSGISDQKVLLTIGHYSQHERGLILYNHLYFSDLPDEYKDALLFDDFFLKIVNHQKFNPRLIEWLSSFRRLRDVSVEHYRAFVEGLLADPSEIWRHAYDQQIGEASRSVLLTLFTLGGNADGEFLERAFKRLHKARAERYGFMRQADDFPRAIRELANAFIQPAGAKRFDVLDPSVLDLMNAVVRTAPDNAVDLILGAMEFGQVERIWSLATAHAGTPILKALRANQALIAPNIAKLLASKGRLKTFGAYDHVEPFSDFTRLTAALKLFAPLDAPAFRALLTERTQAVKAALGKPWTSTMWDGVELARTLEGPGREVPTAKDLLPDLIDAMVEGVRQNPDFHDVKLLVELLDLEDPDEAVYRKSLKAAAETAVADIRELISDSTEYDHLITLEEGLEFFERYLDVDVDKARSAVDDALSEYPDGDEDESDHITERVRGERRASGAGAEAGLRDLFASLRRDRG